jgi:hypothetical protein
VELMVTETIANAYELIRGTHELAIELTLALEALINVTAEDDPKFMPRFGAALEVAKATERAKQHAQVLEHIDSVIATLRASHSQIGNA